MKIKYSSFKCILFLAMHVISVAFTATTANAAQTQPVVYSYWAGWSNASIPNFNFDGLILAFAFMKNDGRGNYYTDYSASGNFQKSSNAGPYTTWNNWSRAFYSSGARSYVSYGGATNGEFRQYVIYANNEQLAKMAGEIKANIKLYYFDGVDLDIEAWWEYNNADNQKFARNLATLVKYLRTSLDNDTATAGKTIMLTVGGDAAGQVPGISSPGSSYVGSMQPFFSDVEAMSATASINIMSYNTCIPNFYARHDLISNILSVFNQAGIPKQKIVFGIQPYECVGRAPATSLSTIVSLGQFIKANEYGGLFMWGMGTGGLGGLSAWDYISAMKTGLGLK